MDSIRGRSGRRTGYLRVSVLRAGAEVVCSAKGGDGKFSQAGDPGDGSMNGSGGGGFVIDTAALFLGVLVLGVLGGIWIWLLSRRRRQSTWECELGHCPNQRSVLRARAERRGETAREARPRLRLLPVVVAGRARRPDGLTAAQAPHRPAGAVAAVRAHTHVRSSAVIASAIWAR